MAAAAPPKPLLWKAAGHPASPASAALWEAGQQLRRLCAAAAAAAPQGAGGGAAVAQLVAECAQDAGEADTAMAAGSRMEVCEGFQDFGLIAAGWTGVKVLGPLVFGCLRP